MQCWPHKGEARVVFTMRSLGKAFITNKETSQKKKKKSSSKKLSYIYWYTWTCASHLATIGGTSHRQKKDISCIFNLFPLTLFLNTYRCRHTTFLTQPPPTKISLFPTLHCYASRKSGQNKLPPPLNYAFITDIPKAFLISQNLGFSYPMVSSHILHVAILAINTCYSNGLPVRL